MQDPVQRYRVYGVTLASEHAFAVPLPRTTAAAVDVAFSVTEDPPSEVDLDDEEPRYVEGMRADGLPNFAYYVLPDRAIVRLTGAMDFHCWPDRIVCHLRVARHRYLIEVALFGMVMSLWLELRRTFTLHASTVVVDGRAVAFSATQGGGKTSLASASVAAGHALLSDDLLALRRMRGRVMAQPGFPQVRMWPEQARHFVGTEEGHESFHPAHDKRRVTIVEPFGTFHSRPAQLARVYLPRRSASSDTVVTIARLSPRESVMALITQSYLPREMASFDLQPSRLAFMSDLLKTAVVARVEVPLGLEQLPRVVAAIEEDVRS